jgi:hypothetical protein
VTDTDIEGLRTTIETIYPTLRGRPDVDVEVFDELLGILAEYRSGRAPRTEAGSADR